MTVLGCLFAGGAGRRLGGIDKALIELSGIPLWKRATDRLSPMVGKLAVTGRDAPAWLEAVPDMVFVPDIDLDGRPIGPAGGLLAALEYGAREIGQNAEVLTIPIDAPYFPSDLYDRLSRARGEAPAAIAQAGARLQPAFGLWSCRLAGEVRECVMQGTFALHAIADHVGAVKVSFDTAEDAFVNINTPEELQQAEALAGKRDLPRQSS